jgi:hypothetical protein
MNNIDKRINYLQRNKKKIIEKCVKDYYENIYISLFNPKKVYRIFEKKINERIEQLKKEEIEMIVLDTTPII